MGEPIFPCHPVSIARRALLAGGAGLLLAPPAWAAPDFGRQVAAMEGALGGRIGVAALDLGSGKRLSHRGGERFAMCSSFKWLLAAVVLARVDKGELQRNRRLAYSAKDLLGFAPVSRAHVGQGYLTIEALCAAAVEFSDNTAANLLLPQVGGPMGLTRFLRGIGDPATRLDRTEPALNSNLPGDPRDTTMPDVMVQTMKTLLAGNVLKAESRARLIRWLKASQTGLGRLRSGLPRDWVAGDKTGTGAQGPSNDNAIAWPPNRAPVLMVTYVDARGATAEAREVPHGKIAALIAQTFAA